MTRGQRPGQLTKADLVVRIATSLLEKLHVDTSSENASAALQLSLQEFYNKNELFGHAQAHGLLSELESCESSPQTVSTVPCYLYTHVANPHLRDVIERYVLAASLLFERGSNIVNMIVALCEEQLVQEQIDELDMWSHKLGSLDNVVSFITDADTLKQCFLPERWPTDSVKLHDLVASALDASRGELAHLLPDWKGVMLATGWDNALNRMASKYLANVKVMTQKGCIEAFGDYAVAILTRRNAFAFPTLAELVTFQDAVRSTVQARPRPLCIHNDEYGLLTQLRAILGCGKEDTTWYPLSNRPFSAALLKTRILMARALGRERLPSVSRGRHFAYLDAKILNALTSAAFADDKKLRKEVFPAQAPLDAVFGVSPEAYNQTRRRVRRSIRRHSRRRYGKDRGCRVRKELYKKSRRLGKGIMPRDARVHSVETDGVGLRIVIQRPDHKAIARIACSLDTSILEEVLASMNSSKNPLTPVEAVKVAKAVRAASKKEKKACAKGHGRATTATATAAPSTEEQWLAEDDASGRVVVVPCTRSTAFVGIDTGRCKIQTCAATPSALQVPSTLVLTRKAYYAVMRHWRRRRWERDRTTEPRVKAALKALSDAALTSAFLSPKERLLRGKVVEQEHWGVLYEEFVVEKGRALWKMRTLRRKKSCLDRSCASVIRAATCGDMSRDVVIGIGDGGFGSSGPGFRFMV